MGFFLFEGCIINKGVTKNPSGKNDEDLSLRLQHHLKQGLFQRLLPFNGLSANQIGNESMLQTLLNYPPLAGPDVFIDTHR